MADVKCLTRDLSAFKFNAKPGQNFNQEMLFIPREEDVQTLPHPVISSLPPARVSMPNRFAKALYYKYPFLLPKRYPEDDESTVAHPMHAEHYKTSYSMDFCIKEDPVYIVRAPGKRAYTEKLQVRDPETPYMPGVYTNEITKSPRWDWKPAPPLPVKKENIYPPSSEYNDNINRMANIFNNVGVFRKSSVRVKHQKTLPPFD